MRGRSHEDSVVEWDLRRWGFWAGVQYAAEGYPPQNTLAQIFSGRTDNPGHRIVCVDPPERFWEINRNVLLLRRELYEVLVARYALPMKSTGHPYYVSELSEYMRIKPETFLDRLAKAKRGYKSIIFSDLALTAAAC